MKEEKAKSQTLNYLKNIFNYFLVMTFISSFLIVSTELLYNNNILLTITTFECL